MCQHRTISKQFKAHEQPQLQFATSVLCPVAALSLQMAAGLVAEVADQLDRVCKLPREPSNPQAAKGTKKLIEAIHATKHVLVQGSALVQKYGFENCIKQFFSADSFKQQIYDWNQRLGHVRSNFMTELQLLEAEQNRKAIAEAKREVCPIDTELWDIASLAYPLADQHSPTHDGALQPSPLTCCMPSLQITNLHSLSCYLSVTPTNGTVIPYNRGFQSVGVRQGWYAHVLLPPALPPNCTSHQSPTCFFRSTCHLMHNSSIDVPCSCPFMRALGLHPSHPSEPLPTLPQHLTTLP